VKVAVPLVSQNILELTPCHYEVVGSLERKTYGIEVTGVPKLPTAGIVIGYKREHVEKLLFHRNREGAVTIISEDEAKRRGIILV
jgi:hypothetical protein